jgi:hypothetical protein
VLHKLPSGPATIPVPSPATRQPWCNKTQHFSHWFCHSCGEIDCIPD